jgi:hypothetical protein
MRSATAPLPRRLALLSILVVAGHAGCTRDLALPEPPTSPTVASFAPQAAFAGQLVRITGQHFSGAASENTVNFAHASARGERMEDGALLVRVPPAAGTGPITISNREGSSHATVDPFTYLGLGEPARLQVASRSPILQRPRAVYAMGGEVVLDSALYGGLVWSDHPTFTTPTVQASAADPDLGLLYYVFSDASGAQLVAVDGATGALTAGPVALPDVPHQIVPVAGKALVLTFRTSDAGEEVVKGWSASDLTPLFGETPYGLVSFDGAADSRSGRVVVAGIGAWGDPLELFLLDLRSTPTPPPAAVRFACPSSFPDPAGPPGGPCPPELGTDLGGRVPVGATLITSSGRSVAAVALADGNVAYATLGDFMSPIYSGLVETFSPAPIESLTIGWGSGVAVATKPDAGYALGYSFFSGMIDWIVEANQPTSVATLLQPTLYGTTDLVFIASASENDILVANASSGLTIGRVNFDVGPRVEGFDAAFVTTGAGYDGDVIFPASTFPGLLRVPTGDGFPSTLARTPDLLRVAAAPETGTIWAASGGAAPRLEGFLGYLDGLWDSAVSVELAEVPQRLAARGTQALVAHGGGLSLVDGIAPPAATAPTAAVPGFDSPTFLGAGFTPEGDVWIVVTDFAVAEAQLWPADAIAPGGAPRARVAVMAGAHSAAWLEDGLWIFGVDDGGTPQATLLDGSFRLVGSMATSGRLGEVQSVSPNGRLLVCREFGGALGFPLRFFRADPVAGFPEAGSLIFMERIEGFTFDRTGERLYVLTQNPDGIVTVD